MSSLTKPNVYERFWHFRRNIHPFIICGILGGVVASHIYQVKFLNKTRRRPAPLQSQED